jgi:hypothetical protein
MTYGKLTTVLLIAGLAAGLVVTAGIAQSDREPGMRQAPGGTRPDKPPREGGPRPGGKHRDRLDPLGHPRPPRLNPEQYAEQMGRMVGLIEHMNRASFNPEAAGLMAIGGLRTDVDRDISEIIADLEEVLAETKSLGLRNSLRLSLRDLYKETGQNDKVLATLREMVAENDKAIEADEKRPPRRPEQR